MKYFLPLIFILLLSCNKDKVIDSHVKATWINEAFSSLTSNTYPRVKAISWWHENFDASRLRVDSSPESTEAYKNGVASSQFVTNPIFVSSKLQAPSAGMYHSAYPDFGGTEDVVSIASITAFENLVGKNITWAYFSNNWYDSIRFPANNVALISQAGKVPFIRMMPRSNFDEGGPDPTYTMQKIIDGVFDAALIQWAIDAASTGIPLLVEFGTEVNGNWFPWNGQYNGAGSMVYGDPTLEDGPERFRDAYRHIIDLCNANGANNITWFFHVDAYSEPDISWNYLENYYPGDTYIDWIGVSVYGPQMQGEDYQTFSDAMNDVYPSLTNLSNKPIAVLEFAITE